MAAHHNGRCFPSTCMVKSFPPHSKIPSTAAGVSSHWHPQLNNTEDASVKAIQRQIFLLAHSASCSVSLSSHSLTAYPSIVFWKDFHLNSIHKAFKYLYVFLLKLCIPALNTILFRHWRQTHAPYPTAMKLVNSSFI